MASADLHERGISKLTMAVPSTKISGDVYTDAWWITGNSRNCARDSLQLNCAGSGCRGCHKYLRPYREFGGVIIIIISAALEILDAT